MILSIVLGLLTVASPLQDRSVDGVRMPERIEESGKKLELNGMGLRTKTILAIKVYVAGLYLEKRSTEAKSVISSEQGKRVQLVFLRSVDRSQVADAIEQGFARNAGD